MKKNILFILLISAALVSLYACGGGEGDNGGKLSVVAVNFPAYDFARQTGGDAVSITLLLPPGTEGHSYEPTAKDIIKIQNCKLFIYTGGESDAWVDDILSSLPSPVKTVKMLDSVKKLTELEVGADGHEHEHGEYDEHVWTSPENAILIASDITEALCGIDAENAARYRENMDAYRRELTELDGEFKAFFAGVSNKTLIFGDRFPFRYFADAYGLDCYAAFPGCASQAEPSAATVALLSDKIKAGGIGTVFYIEFSNHLVADSLAESTGTVTACLNSCHNVTKKQLSDGATYISLMKENLTVLKGAMQ